MSETNTNPEEGDVLKNEGVSATDGVQETTPIAEEIVTENTTMKEVVIEAATPEDDFSFDITSVFDDELKSNELPSGVHENVVLLSIDPERKKDSKTGKLIKKQLYLKFKKFNSEGLDVGAKDVSFFLLDPSRESVMSNLHSFLAQVTELLSLYCTPEELEASFDPFKVLVDESAENSEEQLLLDYNFYNVKKAILKKTSLYVKLEAAICQQAASLLEGKVGKDSMRFRLKLEESSDGKYVQIPRFDRFVENMDVKKEKSLLYNA